MKLRAPAMPLITVDPYFSVWAPQDKLNTAMTQHWTGAKNEIIGTVVIDGRELSFLGYHRDLHKMTQVFSDYDALSTYYTFECEELTLNVRFMTPLLPTDFDRMTRPVSYMEVSYAAKDGKKHDVSVRVTVGASLCLNTEKQSPVVAEEVTVSPTIKAIRMGNAEQNPLNRSGDDLRIDWGYFYLAVRDATVKFENVDVRDVVRRRAECPLAEGDRKLFLFAYDDVVSINYFGKALKSYWNRDGKTIETAICEASDDYAALTEKCDAFSDDLFAKAEAAGGVKYAEMLALSYRQIIAAHKLVLDENGEVLFVSKECFSNGCAVTVDVSYPSIPLFLYYNPELVKGMMRPIYRYAASDAWKFDFAPHDAGRYPLVTGQVYGLNRETGELRYDKQMPVEECGNMIIMETNVALAERDASFAAAHIDTLKAWCEYLIKYGDDPENQLCTDDFAGHLAHNCNLSLKAIMGIEGMSILSSMLGDKAAARNYAKIARAKAKSWMERAANGDGSYRLAFDQPGTFSMKYNLVWDKVWGTKVFPASLYKSEVRSNFKHFEKYGMPLDSRADYTKSDWILWTATMLPSEADFKKYIAPVWQAFNDSDSRVAMTDWYDVVSALKVSFQHRSVQGGLFIKMLDADGKLKV